MRTINTLIYPKWIVPIEPLDLVLEEHALALHEGQIVDLLPAQAAQQRYTAETSIKLENHAVLPGFINAHTHSPMTLMRGIADDLQLMDWLKNYMWPIEAKFLSDDFAYDGTQLAILEMLRGGTTCFNENFFFPEAMAKATHDMGMRACISPTIIDFRTPDQCLEEAIKLYQNWQDHPLIQIHIAPHAPYTVSDENFLKIKKIIDQYNLILHLHLHETQNEIEESLKTYHMRPLQRMERLGLVSEKLQCIHMTQITAEDIKILQKSAAHVVHCPQSNLKLASGFCPVKELMDADINIALGTDGAASNNDLDMFSEMQTASLLAKAVSKNPTALNAMQSLQMATLNGAKALGLADKIGSLKVGKAADIIAVELTDYNTQPLYDPISHLVYAVNSRQVTDVWIAGNRLLETGKFKNIDTSAILQKVTHWQQQLAPYRYIRRE